MSRKCTISGKGSIVGGRYSNRTRATKFNPGGKKRRFPNMQKKKVFVPETGEAVIITASTRGLKTMRKNGVAKTLQKNNLII